MSKAARRDGSTSSVRAASFVTFLVGNLLTIVTLGIYLSWFQVNLGERQPLAREVRHGVGADRSPLDGDVHHAQHRPFPAAWLLGEDGGWPYAGGEIDIVEARDLANEVYQTYHHGRCVAATWADELLFEPGSNGLRPVSNGGCALLPTHRSIQLTKGLTIPERTYFHGSNPSNEFWTRDHVFSAEWSEQEITFYVNAVRTHSVTIGAAPSSVYLLSGPALPPGGVPSPWDRFAAHNFPSYAMYWILNQSVYVPQASWGSFQPQELRIDYVMSYARCITQADFCPCGGTFAEDQGCRLGGAPLACPRDVPQPVVQGALYASECVKRQMVCVAGGIPFGPNCQVHAFPGGALVQGVSYWADADPRWPGVFYAGVNGSCPYGGAGGQPNCQILAFPDDALESGVGLLGRHRSALARRLLRARLPAVKTTFVVLHTLDAGVGAARISEQASRRTLGAASPTRRCSA